MLTVNMFISVNMPVLFLKANTHHTDKHQQTGSPLDLEFDEK